MLVQVNTDNHIQGREDLARYVEGVVRDGLGHFTEQVTRVEVHLRDVNSGKGGSDDKQCTMEVRPEGRPPMAATASSDNLRDAINGATDKLRSSLETVYGKMASRH